MFFWAWFTLGTSFYVWLPSPFYKGCPPSPSLSLASSLLGGLVALINTRWCMQIIPNLANVRKQIQWQNLTFISSLCYTPLNLRIQHSSKDSVQATEQGHFPTIYVNIWNLLLGTGETTQHSAIQHCQKPGFRIITLSARCSANLKSGCIFGTLSRSHPCGDRY